MFSLLRKPSITQQSQLSCLGMQAARRALQSSQASTGLIAGVAAASVGAYAIYSYSTSRGSLTGEPRKIFPGGPAFVSLRLNSVEEVNHNTKRLKFEFPEENALSGLSLTSALLTFSKPEGRFFPVIRPYTPISDLDQPGFIELLIKRYPKGAASTHIHSLTPGQSLFFIAPIRAYKYTPNQHSSILLIAGGAGITPMYQLIQGILKNPSDRTKITLVFGVNSSSDVLFEKEFSEYEKQHPEQFRVIYTISNPAEKSLVKKGFENGYVTKELLEKVALKNEKVFVCGPPAMEKALTGRGGILGQLGYDRSQVFKF